MTHAIHTDARLRNRRGVFTTRTQAGRHLAGMLRPLLDDDPDPAIILAIPAGGVPVAKPIADALGLPLDVAVVSKVTLPWTTEAGYGAVAFDGSATIDEALASRFRLTDEQISDGIARTRAKVERRLEALRGGRELPDIEGKTVILVDDGLASGSTMRVAIDAVRGRGARRIVVAVPTSPEDTVERIATEVDTIVCANVRGERPFAVAAAYREWYDVSEDEAQDLLDAA